MKPASDDGIRDFSESLPMLLLNAHQSVMAQFRPLLREYGITEQQWRVLRALNSADTRVTLAELSSRTQIMAPSMTRIIRNLDQAGLIIRSVHRDDLRASSLKISARGKSLIRKVAPHSEKQYERIARHIGSQKLQRLSEDLRLLSGALPPD